MATFAADAGKALSGKFPSVATAFPKSDGVAADTVGVGFGSLGLQCFEGMAVSAFGPDGVCILVAAGAGFAADVGKW